MKADKDNFKKLSAVYPSEAKMVWKFRNNCPYKDKDKRIVDYDALVQEISENLPTTKEQKRVKKIVEYLKNYILTYDNQRGYLNYSDKTIIDDMLYGLGVAISSKKYSFSVGFKIFKDKLFNYLRDIKQEF